MKMTFRWYGYDDKNTLNYIRQIPGVTGVVTALYTVPVGEVWPEDEIKKSQMTFVKRLIAGALVFFVFVIVKFAIDVFSDEPDNDEIKPDFGNCLNCLINNEGCVEIADSPFEPD